MKINDELTTILTGSTAVTATFGERVYKEFLPENFFDMYTDSSERNAIVFETDVTAKRGSLNCSTYFAFDYSVRILVFSEIEQTCEDFHDTIVELFEGYSSKRMSGIDFESDNFEFDPDLRLNVLELEFSTTFFLE
jgi:hypothetical protein